MSKINCATPPCMATETDIVHCKYHDAGPKALMLLKETEDYLRSFRATPRRNALLHGMIKTLDEHTERR